MISLRAKKITRTQQKIMVAGIIVLVVFVLFILWVYLPARREFAALKSQVQGLEGQIQEIDKLVARNFSPEQVSAALMRKYQDAQRKFPDSEGPSVVLISDYARRFGLAVDSIEVGNQQLFLDSGGNKITVGNNTCYAVNATVSLRGNYDNLIKYLGILKKVMPAFISINGFNIAKYEVSPYRLKIRLDLTFYLLK